MDGSLYDIRLTRLPPDAARLAFSALGGIIEFSY